MPTIKEFLQGEDINLEKAIHALVRAREDLQQVSEEDTTYGICASLRAFNHEFCVPNAISIYIEQELEQCHFLQGWLSNEMPGWLSDDHCNHKLRLARLAWIDKMIYDLEQP
jgi:hypothetical protein